MKRILALLLALCLLSCLVACENEGTDSDVSSNILQTESTDTLGENETTTSSESETESSVSTPNSSETASTSSKPTEASKPTTSTTSKPTDTSKPTTSTTTKPTETHTHSWGNWRIETKALVGKDGTEKRTCSGCKETETRSTTKDAIFNSFFDELRLEKCSKPQYLSHFLKITHLDAH